MIDNDERLVWSFESCYSEPQSLFTKLENFDQSPPNKQGDEESKEKCHRKSWSLEEKVKHVKTFLINGGLYNNCKAEYARKAQPHSIPRKTFCQWLADKEILRLADSECVDVVSNPPAGSKYRKRKSDYLAVEKELVNYINHRTRFYPDNRSGLSYADLKAKAMEFALHTLSEEKTQSFKASNGFIGKVLKRNNLERKTLAAILPPFLDDIHDHLTDESVKSPMNTSNTSYHNLICTLHDDIDDDELNDHDDSSLAHSLFRSFEDRLTDGTI
jgi:hypothetical protein